MASMKIADAALSLQSTHVSLTREEKHETLRAWVESAAQPVRISAAGRAAQSAEAQAIEAASDAVANDPFLQMIRSMIEMLTGRSVRVFDARELDRPGTAEAPTQPPAVPAREAPPSRAGFGIEYEYHAVREESEQTTFAAQGVVRTEDGREISFRLDLAMAREHREETNVSLRAGAAVRKDPLVVNFAGHAAQLADQRFRFDLDADGVAEEVPLLGPGSGYLALDLNGNGRVDSGAELFGPASGSGFGELARLDDDGNGWIDESDAAFARLRVWTPAADGAGPLTTLKEAQVGALFLGHVATPFELRGQANADLGAVRASGLYLTEAGEARGIQEIDLTV